MPHAAVDGLIIPAASQAIAETTIPFIYDIILEVCAVGNALYPSKEDGDETLFPREKAKDILRGMGTLASKATSKERPSILVDVESGRPTEVEVLVGEVVRMGRKLAIPIPVSVVEFYFDASITNYEPRTAFGNVLCATSCHANRTPSQEQRSIEEQPLEAIITQEGCRNKTTTCYCTYTGFQDEPPRILRTILDFFPIFFNHPSSLYNM